jgi:hypothetical protein
VDWICETAAKVERMFDAIEHAKACGTLNALDRSKQYPGMDHELLTRAVNDAWTKIRICERDLSKKEHAIEDLRKKLRNYRVANIALTSVLTGLAWEGLKALIALVHH